MPAEGGIPPVPVGNITGMDDQHYNKWEDIWANKRTMEQCLSQDTKYKNYIKKEEFFLRCGRSRKWRKRMCVLRGHFLYYFKASNNKQGAKEECRGAILLKHCFVSTFPMFDGKPHVLMICPRTSRKPGWRFDATRKFYLSITSGENGLKLWKTVLTLIGQPNVRNGPHIYKPTTPLSSTPSTDQQQGTSSTTCSSGGQQTTNANGGNAA